MTHPGVLVLSTDPQGSAVWWANRIPDELMPFHFTQADDDPALIAGALQKLKASGAKIHVIASQKGGVGKTTTTMNLAAVTAAAIAGRADGYLHVFVDTPGYVEAPGADNSKVQQILETALDEADDVLIPLPPEGLAFDATARTVRMLKEREREKPFRIVVNNWDPRDGEVDRDQTIAYVKAQGWPRTEVVVRRYKVHTRASIQGELVTLYRKGRVTAEAQNDYRMLAMEQGYGGRP